MCESNEEIINKVVEMHFNNEDWKTFLKSEIRRRNKLNELLKAFGEDISNGQELCRVNICDSRKSCDGCKGIKTSN
ncbi:hypothetical protein [Hathewaya histolytica]|uniref:hypothetical protein n=1 Tax=Hathewaya histolytica TaxID=1498 RepID=UPI0010FF3EDF|nr:hypothetical protein [Hathewaya histolytica]